MDSWFWFQPVELQKQTLSSVLFVFVYFTLDSTCSPPHSALKLPNSMVGRTNLTPYSVTLQPFLCSSTVCTAEQRARDRHLCSRNHIKNISGSFPEKTPSIRENRLKLKKKSSEVENSKFSEDSLRLASESLRNITTLTSESSMAAAGWFLHFP